MEVQRLVASVTEGDAILFKFIDATYCWNLEKRGGGGTLEFAL